MSGQTDLLRVLKRGPATNAVLAELTCDHGGSVARTMAKLIASGRAKRIDGGSGRGSIAVYALADTPAKPITEPVTAAPNPLGTDDVSRRGSVHTSSTAATLFQIAHDLGVGEP